jgi:hypothetical protein
MNYLPFVSWGMYAGAGVAAARRANYFASWGLMEILPTISGMIGAAMYYYRRMME